MKMIDTGIKELNFVLISIEGDGSEHKNKMLRKAAFMKPCEKDEPNIRQCLINIFHRALPFFAKGDPKIGAPAIDPFRMDRFSSVDGFGQEIEVFRFELYGLRAMKIKGVDFNPKEPWLNFTGEIDALHSIFDIKLDSYIGGERFKGRALSENNYTKVSIDLNYKYGVTKGKDHYNVVDLEVNAVPELYQIKILSYEGHDHELEKWTNHVNDNWRDAVKTTAPIINSGIRLSFLQTEAAYLKVLPYENYYIPITV